MKEKVFEIEFHIHYHELSDFILRAAELIKEGYSIVKIETDTVSLGDKIKLESLIHIALQKGKENYHD